MTDVSTPGWLDLSEADYIGATVTLLRHRKTKTKENRIGFARIDLLPPGALKPAINSNLAKACGALEVRFLPSSNKTLVWPVAEALQFFLWFTETQKAELLRHGSYEPCVLAPGWPALAIDTLGVDRKRGSLALPPLNGISTLIAGLLDEDEAKRELVLERLGLPLWREPWRSLIGGARLVVPNPLVSAVRVTPTTVGGKFRREIDFEVRPGVRLTSVSTLTFQALAENDVGPTSVETREVDGKPLVFEVAGDKFGYVMSCRKRGILSYRPVDYFKDIAINASVVGSEVHVYELPAVSSHRPAESHEVTPIAYVQRSGPGPDSAPTANRRIWRMRERMLAEKAMSTEVWFGDRSVDRAVAFVRRLASEASSDVMFVDPYFGAIDIGRFAVVSPSPNVTVRVLTSKLALELGRNRIASRRRMRTLISRIENLRRTQGLKIEFREMGEVYGKPAIHDRFIALDRAQIWHVGGSFNELGTRGTMLVKLETTDTTMARLEAAWQSARPLDEDAVKAAGSLVGLVRRLRDSCRESMKKGEGVASKAVAMLRTRFRR